MPVGGVARRRHGRVDGDGLGLPALRLELGDGPALRRRPAQGAAGNQGQRGGGLVPELLDQLLFSLQCSRSAFQRATGRIEAANRATSAIRLAVWGLGDR